MQVPLELAFVHTDPTDWAEGEIRERLAKPCDGVTKSANPR
jgi:hypothetical protein